MVPADHDNVLWHPGLPYHKDDQFQFRLVLPSVTKDCSFVQFRAHQTIVAVRDADNTWCSRLAVSI
jgi:hypothetical protein